MMDIITLPQQIKATTEQTDNDFFVYKYISDKYALKNKVLLQQNLICFLQNGEKVLQYAGKKTTLNNEQLAILTSGNCLSTEKLSNDKKYRSILFFFDNSILTNFFVKYASIIDKGKSKTEPLEEPFIVVAKDDFIRSFINSLESILEHKLSISHAMMQLKFEEFMLYLLEKYPKMVLSLQISKKEERSDFEIKKAVELNITSNITIEELAFLCNVSISTFKRRFVKLYNTTPSQYFLKRKMEIASSLLLKNENPSEVFFKVGYENHSSFSQSFKQIFGISPKQYQQQKLTVYP